MYNIIYKIKHKSFTMAEILLSLTIIGVVAAITLPSLTGNINERIWDAQRKALFSRITQAISVMGTINGYGTYDGHYVQEEICEEEDWDNDGVIDDSWCYDGDVYHVSTDTAAMAFVKDGLSKVLKLNNICDNEHFQDCGIPEKLAIATGSTIDVPKTLTSLNDAYYGGMYNPVVNTKAVAFETHNKESIVDYYNPRCISDTGGYSIDIFDQYYLQNFLCANFLYDLNGKKGPNFIGKDMGFITALYSTDPNVVAPMALNSDATLYNLHVETLEQAKSTCKSQSNDARLPTRDEIFSMYVNRLFLLNPPYYSRVFWTSTEIPNNKIWGGSLSGIFRVHDKSVKLYTWCFRKK